MDTRKYEQALQRAHDEQLEITMLESEVAHVHNPARGTGYYTVRYPIGSRVLTCNCQAGQVGTYCKHRALVHEALAARKARQDGDALDVYFDRLQQQADRQDEERAQASKYARDLLADGGWLGMTRNERAEYLQARAEQDYWDRN